MFYSFQRNQAFGIDRQGLLQPAKPSAGKSAAQHEAGKLARRSLTEHFLNYACGHLHELLARFEYKVYVRAYTYRKANPGSHRLGRSA
jgi:hypothetical protein